MRKHEEGEDDEEREAVVRGSDGVSRSDGEMDSSSDSSERTSRPSAGLGSHA